MAGENAKVGRVFSPASLLSQTAARSSGIELDPTQWDANQYRKPDYFVHLYTVSDREFIVCQPPLVSRLIIAPRLAGQRYSLVGSLPSPFNQLDREGGVGDLITRAHIAERVAMSIVNPNNFSLDQDAKLPDGAILGLGVDLNSQGIFWSRNNPPTEEEVTKAEARKERYYRLLLEKARTLEIANPKELEFAINQDYHMAAEYFKIETTWHKKLVRMEDCPNCGEPVKSGLAYHKNSLGFLCIIDAERAAKAGAVTGSPTSKV
jgi:hypothetical protein